MLTYHSVDFKLHHGVTAPSDVRIERSARQYSVWDHWDRMLASDHRHFNEQNFKMYGMNRISDFQETRNQVIRRPLEAWNHLQNFAAQGAAFGGGAGVIVGIGLGALCWPLAIGCMALGGFIAGTVQYDALDKARHFDEVLLFLGSIGDQACRKDSDLAALQDQVKNKSKNFSNIKEIYVPLANSMLGFLEQAKSDPRALLNPRYHTYAEMGFEY